MKEIFPVKQSLITSVTLKFNLSINISSYMSRLPKFYLKPEVKFIAFASG